MSVDKKAWSKDLMPEVNKGDCRIVLNGKRHYTTPHGALPSVTTILSETASEANKKKLEMWSKANPGVKEQAAERGTFIHAKCEDYLTHGIKDPEVPEEYRAYWEGMPAILEQFDECIWSEVPLLEEHKYTIGSDGIARVWHADEEGRGYAGAPDIIANVKGKLILADIKTSFKPYSRKWPKDYPKGSQEWRDLLGGYMKYKKTVKQLAAYDRAIEHTLGLKVDGAAILVSTPIRTQVFKISRRFLDMVWEDWQKIVVSYYEQLKESGPVDYDAY